MRFVRSRKSFAPFRRPSGRRAQPIYHAPIVRPSKKNRNLISQAPPTTTSPAPPPSSSCPSHCSPPSASRSQTTTPSWPPPQPHAPSSLSLVQIADSICLPLSCGLRSQKWLGFQVWPRPPYGGRHSRPLRQSTASDEIRAHGCYLKVVIAVADASISPPRRTAPSIRKDPPPQRHQSFYLVSARFPAYVAIHPMNLIMACPTLRAMDKAVSQLMRDNTKPSGEKLEHDLFSKSLHSRTVLHHAMKNKGSRCAYLQTSVLPRDISSGKEIMCKSIC